LAPGRTLLNPGSVGQPRDGDPRAAYVLLDLDARTVSFRRVEYDIAATQAEIREAGLPELLAARLTLGM
jgi:diadenosine tetraphosphatase ApaH/serine/threonine PP2A family protein phosphatase